MKPADIPAVNRILKRDYETHAAPIVELIRAQTQSPFQILLAVLLSARTKDETTAAVCDRLFRVIHTPDDLRRLTVKEIESLIFPIGFYHTKARHLKAMPDALDTKFGGCVPDTIEELCQLPGVGRKTANLVLINAFDKHGMCVDVHVHRISNRLGLIETQSPLASEMALRETLPRRYWKTWNRYLVSFGQRVCRPVGPHCTACPLGAFCNRVGVKRH
jgi:endonuclease III